MDSFIEELQRLTGFNFRRTGGTFIAISDNMSDADNFHGNTAQRVKVIHWFDDFWLYIQISLSRIELVSENPRKREMESQWYQEHSLKLGDDFFTITFTLSVFQGVQHDVSKAQLFRAEWDNYEQIADHPQPHWQIYPYKYDRAAGLRSAADFNSLIELRVEGFEQTLATEGTSFISIQDFHFAMHGAWALANGTDHHRILNVSSLGNWLNGMIRCIQLQLRFLQDGIAL